MERRHGSQSRRLNARMPNHRHEAEGENEARPGYEFSKTTPVMTSSSKAGLPLASKHHLLGKKYSNT